MRDKILALLREGLSYKQISGIVGCAKSSVCYHAKRHDLVRTLRKIPWGEVEEYYLAGHTRKECLHKFGLSRGSWCSARFKGKLKVPSKVMPVETFLVDDREGTSRGSLKRKLIRLGILKLCCYNCGLTHWMGKQLTLQLDHINGKPKDNRLENLRLLCPNCHSQTPTFCGKNMKR